MRIASLHRDAKLPLWSLCLHPVTKVASSEKTSSSTSWRGSTGWRRSSFRVETFALLQISRLSTRQPHCLSQVRGWLRPSFQTCGRWSKASVNLLSAANRGLTDAELHIGRTYQVLYISNFAFEETVLLHHNVVYDVMFFQIRALAATQILMDVRAET